MPSPKLLKSGEISEYSIQKTVIHWVKMQPNIQKLVIHIPNEGKRSARYGRLLKDMGMVAGASDLFIAKPSHGFGGAWIELKSKNGVLSTAQVDFLNEMSAQNYFTAVCRSIDESIKIIKWYCCC